jgi:hypothetical protein
MSGEVTVFGAGLHNGCERRLRFPAECAGRVRARNESAPVPGALPIQPVGVSGSDLGLDLQELAGTRDRDRPKLHRLRNLAYEVDVQEPVLQPRAFDLVGGYAATAVLSVSAMACFLSLAPLASLMAYEAGARPDHPITGSPA